ncbi:MAG: nitroreductase, partial [Alphaproteobacteria bacterium]|nr:nitroreductase [Alphaproteobacteria bacterium]
MEDVQKGPVEIEALLRQRRSVRGFRPDPVPYNVLNAVFAQAQLAPSNCNVQPWIVHVVSGAKADDVRTQLKRHVMSGAAAGPDFPLTGSYPGEYRTRQIGAAVALFEATGVARDDKPARMLSMLRNFEFFDAPHALFLFMPEWAGWREAADCGMYAQSLMLAMAAHGIGSCAQGALSHYASFIKPLLGVPDDHKL